MKAIRVHALGGPEVLKLETVPDPEPGPGEAVVAIEAAGINFIDVYHRTGLYPHSLPFTPGQEGAGTVRAIGPGVREVRVGERVAFATGAGAYAEQALVRADRLVPVPEGVNARTAAAVMVQGMTAHYLATDTFRLGPGTTCLVHAAAGGVGLLLCRIARILGARVIGTTSTPEKAERARASGAEHVILYGSEPVAETVRRLTEGAGVDVVYDSVGQSTFEASLDALRPRGMLVSFGQASGPVPPLDPLVLSRKGSLFLTRPTLAHYVATREHLLARARDVLGWVAAGVLEVHIHRVWPLAEAAHAHRELQSRASSGKLLLVP